MIKPKKTFSFFRWLLIFVLAAVGISFLSGIICAVKYYRILKDPPAPVIISKASFPDVKENRIILGESAVCRTVIRAPWGTSPEAPEVIPGTGIQLISDPVFKTGRTGWGTTDWILDLNLQAYRTGESGKGTFRFSFRGPDRNPTMFAQEIPALNVQEIPADPADSELALAKEIPEKTQKNYFWWIAAGGVLLVLLVVWLIYSLVHRKTSVDPVKTWKETALDAIKNLRLRVEKHQEAVEAAMAELTDIVRHFLEKQYALRAERQTTTEFLHDLDRADSPMSDPDRKFLRRFLEAADMVKFARISADTEAFDNAALRAEKLIGETVPPENEGGKE